MGATLCAVVLGCLQTCTCAALMHVSGHSGAMCATALHDGNLI